MQGPLLICVIEFVIEAEQYSGSSDQEQIEHPVASNAGFLGVHVYVGERDEVLQTSPGNH